MSWILSFRPELANNLSWISAELCIPGHSVYMCAARRCQSGFNESHICLALVNLRSRWKVFAWTGLICILPMLKLFGQLWGMQSTLSDHSLKLQLPMSLISRLSRIFSHFSSVLPIGQFVSNLFALLLNLPWMFVQWPLYILVVSLALLFCCPNVVCLTICIRIVHAVARLLSWLKALLPGPYPSSSEQKFLWLCWLKGEPPGTYPSSVGAKKGGNSSAIPPGT